MLLHGRGQEAAIQVTGQGTKAFAKPPVPKRSIARMRALETRAVLASPGVA